MKKRISVICLLVFIVGLFMRVYAHTNEALKGKTIIIDSGHGGVDPGTVYNEIYEKDINLQISLKLKKLLEKNGTKVLMTREGDYDLSSPSAMFRKKNDFDNRIKMINNSNADLYISIHLNFLENPNYYGPQVFYLNGNEKLANIIQKSLNKISESQRVIKLIPQSTYMYKKLAIKGVLIECGFLSNGEERNKLTTDDYQLLLANAIINALRVYFT